VTILAANSAVLCEEDRTFQSIKLLTHQVNNYTSSRCKKETMIRVTKCVYKTRFRNLLQFLLFQIRVTNIRFCHRRINYYQCWHVFASAHHWSTACLNWYKFVFGFPVAELHTIAHPGLQGLDSSDAAFRSHYSSNLLLTLLVQYVAGLRKPKNFLVCKFYWYMYTLY